MQEYNDKKIDGYQAEQKISMGYKTYLKQNFRYVLDMPIRMKPDQRPKYRMIHVSDHEDGCFLMAQNMQKRKDELFINIQQGDQMSIFDLDDVYSSSVEGEVITIEEINYKVEEHALKCCAPSINITRFIASFVNTYGLICDFNTIHNALTNLEQKNIINIIRTPDKTSSGLKSKFWEETKTKTVILQRCQS